MIEVYVDGGSHHNQDPELRKAYGSFKIGTEPVVTRDFGNNTNQEAEYKALINALSVIKNQYSNEEVTIYTDSQLIIGQLTLGWKVKAPNIGPLYIMARSLLTSKIKIVKVNRSILVTILGH